MNINIESKITNCVIYLYLYWKRNKYSDGSNLNCLNKSNPRPRFVLIANISSDTTRVIVCSYYVIFLSK